MLKKNDQIKIMFLSMNLMEFCHKASETIIPNPDYSDSMQQTCMGLSKIFSSLEKDFETISKLIMNGFTKKEIKAILEKKKCGIK